MAHVHKTPNGRWRATADAGGRRCSRTFDRRADAVRWADDTEATARLLSTVPSDVELTWSTDGLHVFISDELISMDTALVLERLLREVFAARETD